MWNVRAALATVATVTLVGTAAWAGARYPTNVFIDPVSPDAEGAVGTARNSADGNQSIACYITARSDGFLQGGCAATDAKGRNVSCTTTNPGLITAIQSVNGDSLIRFGWDPTDFSCRYVVVVNGSPHEPKKP